MLNSYKEIFSFDPKKNKRVPAGQFGLDTRNFYKDVKPTHYMIKEKGYGISEDVIQQLIHLDCQSIFIKTKKLVYEVSFSSILKKPIKNYGHGLQRFIKI